MPILEITNLTKTFIRGERELKAVDNVNFKLEKSEVILIMGPSGSGKTTLISIIGALLRPTSGSSKFNNKEIFKLSQRKLSKLRLHNIGFIFQNFNLLASLTAVENVEIVALLKGDSKKVARKKALDLLKKLGLADRAIHYPRQLSGGEQQRVAIARALVNNPDIILADEPTGNLDSKSGKEVMILLCSVACNQKKGVIIVTHDLRLKEIADKILWIEDGKIFKEEKIKRTGLKLGQKFGTI